MKRAICLAVLPAIIACARHDAPLGVSSVTLAGGIVAKVGDVEIPAELVSAVAASRGITPRAAAELLIDDALAASGAKARHLETSNIVAREITAARARATAAHVRDVTRANPPTDTEVDDFTHVRWVEVDLPEQVHVIHAVVLRKKNEQGPDDAGPALAREIASAVAAATDATQFEALARKVPTNGREVRVEDLAPFVRDGRVAVAGADSMMDATFAPAAFALPSPGATSGVIETSFGWHVIRLIERLPPKSVPLEERRAYFAEEIYAARARRELDGVLTANRTRARPELNSAAQALMGEVVVASP